MKSVFKRFVASFMIALMLLSVPGDAFAETVAEAVNASEAETAAIDPVYEELDISLAEALDFPEDAESPEADEAPSEDMAADDADILIEAPPEIYLEADVPDGGSPAGSGANSDETSGQDNGEGSESFDVPDPIEGYENLVVSNCLEMGSTTLQSVNIVRAGGYEGPIARVMGKLKLYDVLIDGIPADETDLSEQFELVTGASICLDSDAKLKPTVNALSIDKGKKKTLKLKWKNKTLDGKKAKWRSSNKKVVTVSSTGKIKGVSKGVATITATYKKKKVSYRIVVTNPVTKVTITPSVKYINEQTTQQFTAVAAPETADYPALTWNSSAPEIAQVDQNGLVTALKPGKATISAKAVNGTSASMKIQVIRPAEAMTLPETLRINLDKQKTLKPTFAPEDTSVKTCTWTSSDKKVATVSKKGVVTGKGTGTCVITATSHNGIVSQCTVTVIRPVKSVKMTKSKLTLSLNHTSRLKVKFSPSKASIKTLTWTSSKPSVVSVDENGNIAALKTGKATIKATSYNGKVAKCTVTVKEYKPKSLSFSQFYVTMNPGNTYQAKAKVKPSNTSNPHVIYTSSNPEVATVDETGLITAVSAGSTVIKAKCAAKTGVTASFELFVIEPGSGRMTGLTIGINPGHQTKTITKKYPIAPGSKDKGYGCKVGAVGKWTRIPEYKTVLAIGKKLATMLAEEGATVVLTRTKNNVSITNIERAKMLNKANVDIALQLHCNSSTYSSKNGISAFYRTTGNWVSQSKSAAKALCKAMSAETGLKNKGAEAYNGYMSLNYSTTPAVLLEMGYLSNKKEDKLLATDEFREKMARGIFNGLCKYFDR